MRQPESAQMPPPIAVLDSLFEATSEYSIAQGSEALPHSQARAECAAFQRPESAYTAIGQGAMLFKASADYLPAIARCLTTPILTVAPWACTRALLETSALAAWILDPQIDIRERVSRSLALRFEGVEQQGKWIRAAKGGDAPLKAAARLDEIEKMALGLGYPALVDRKGRRNGIGTLMPPATDLVANVLDKEAEYRLLSAVVHGHGWALQNLSFQPSKYSQGKASTDEKDGVKVTLFDNALNPLSMTLIARTSVTAFAQPLWAMACFFGWDVNPLAEILETHYDRLALEPDSRFWRPKP